MRGPAEEIRQAFSEIANCINRLGVVLSMLAEPALASKTTPDLVTLPTAPPTPAIKATEEHLERAPTAPIKSPKPPKDPNFPKRPMSTFLLFAREQRDKVIRENPGLSYLEVTRKLGQLWETADKRPYEEQSHKLLEDYKKEVEEYQRKSGTEGEGMAKIERKRQVTPPPPPPSSSIVEPIQPPSIRSHVEAAVETGEVKVKKQKSKKKVVMDNIPSSTIEQDVGEKGPLVTIPQVTATASIPQVTGAAPISSQTEGATQKPKKAKKNKQEGQIH